MEQSIASDWYTRTFDALYPVIYAHRSVESAAPEAQFPAECVGLRPADAALDLCCGNGRHLFHLRKRAARLVGLDYSAHLLKLAAETLRPPAEHDNRSVEGKAPAPCDVPGSSDPADAASDATAATKLLPTTTLIRADMRHIPFKSAFDVIFNFFTSFGYFNSREENLRVVRGAARALKDGGRFFIDYVNRAYVERNLVPESVRREESYEIREHRWIDETTQRVNKTTLVLRQKERIAETEESVQLYTLNAFRQLLAEGGLHVERVFGDYRSAGFDDDHPRMIVVGRKV